VTNWHASPRQPRTHTVCVCARACVCVSMCARVCMCEYVWLHVARVCVSMCGCMLFRPASHVLLVLICHFKMFLHYPLMAHTPSTHTPSMQNCQYSYIFTLKSTATPTTHHLESLAHAHVYKSHTQTHTMQAILKIARSWRIW